jgi:hypothetical protein
VIPPEDRSGEYPHTTAVLPNDYGSGQRSARLQASLIELLRLWRIRVVVVWLGPSTFSEMLWARSNSGLAAASPPWTWTWLSCFMTRASWPPPSLCWSARWPSGSGC